MTSGLIYESFRGTPLSLYWACSDQDTQVVGRFPLDEELQNRLLALSCVVMPAASESGTIVLDGCSVAEELLGRFRHKVAFTDDDLYKPRKIELTRFRTTRDFFEVILRRPALSDAEDTYKGPKQIGTSTANLAIIELMVDLAEREATA